MKGPAEERSDALALLSASVCQLEASMKGCLVLPGVSNIAFAIANARTAQDVAAVTGGLVAEGAGVRPAGPAAFGCGGKVALSLLTAMKFEPAVRSAIAIRFSRTSYRILSEMVIESAEVSASGRPAGNGLMDWDIASCCSDGVPDVVAVTGPVPGDGALWLFGEEPARLASNIIILSNRIQ